MTEYITWSELEAMGAKRIPTNHIRVLALRLDVPPYAAALLGHEIWVMNFEFSGWRKVSS